MIKISITTALKIIRSNKDFIFYRVEGQKMVDFTLTNDISRFRSQYNNNFKIAIIMHSYNYYVFSVEEQYHL